MIANYHTHTPRCRHAEGSEREYVENALKRGLKIFGFSDHTPQWFPGTYYSTMRMFPEELEDYCAVVRGLQEQFKGQISIPLGVEAEYYPAIWNQLIRRLQDHGVEYLILGQHWIGNEEGEPGSTHPTTDESILRRYCHQVCDAVETGKVTYIAHPDLINYVGGNDIYRRHIRDLCRSAKQSDTPLELNFLGIASGRHYPNERFWEVAAEEGCKVVFGMDAHAPKHILKTELEEKALEIVRRFDLNLQDTVELRHI